MDGPTADAGFQLNLAESRLAIVAHREARRASKDDVYTENPVGAYRGLTMVLLFNVLLAVGAAVAWGLWRFLH